MRSKSRLYTTIVAASLAVSLSSCQPREADTAAGNAETAARTDTGPAAAPAAEGLSDANIVALLDESAKFIGIWKRPNGDWRLSLNISNSDTPP